MGGGKCSYYPMIFPVVMYGCESPTIKKAECRRIDAFAPLSDEGDTTLFPVTSVPAYLSRLFGATTFLEMSRAKGERASHPRLPQEDP